MMGEKRKFTRPHVDSDTVAELSAKLIEANAKLQEAERERKIMFENISHDLRAPLTAIRSTVDYLKQRNTGDSPDITKEEFGSMLNLLDVRTRTLELLIQDLYFLTCLESGRVECIFEDIPLAQFLEEYYFAAEIDDKYLDYNLKLDVPEAMSDVVSIDVSKMSRVLDNLFTNARKYSDKNADIVLGAFREADKVTFYVKDTGHGIPEEALPFIFDRTYRVTGARTPEKEVSSGLGLSIAKSIVDQHGGVIRCESILGKGSCFYVSLPSL